MRAYAESDDPRYRSDLQNETGKGTYLTHVLNGTRVVRRHSARPLLPHHYPMQVRYAQYTRVELFGNCLGAIAIGFDFSSVGYVESAKQIRVSVN
jgi:hypothetical protein